MTPTLLSILVAAWSALGGTDARADWEKVHSDKGVVVWTRPVPGSDLIEMRAETVIPAAAPTVWSVLSEPHHFDEFMPFTVETRLLERLERGLVVYTVTDPPVISRRDVTVSYTIHVDESGGLYQLKFREATSKAPRLPDGVVRMTRMRGQWRVRAIDAGRCRVRYEVHSEPGGLVPSWIANSAGPGALTDVLVRLRMRVKRLSKSEPGRAP